MPLNRSHWIAIGGVVFAGVVLAAVPLVQRASADAGATAPASTTTSTTTNPTTPPTTRAHPAASLAIADRPNVPTCAACGTVLAVQTVEVGGAVAGNAVERNMKRQTRYDVLVQMTDGRRETVSYDSLPPFRAGEAVRLDGGHLRASV